MDLKKKSHSRICDAKSLYSTIKLNPFATLFLILLTCGDLHTFWSLLSGQIRRDIIFISARMINAHDRIIHVQDHTFLKDGRACFRTDLEMEKRITKRQWYSATRAVCCSEYPLGQIPRRGRAFTNPQQLQIKWPETLWSLVQSAFKNVNVFC